MGEAGGPPRGPADEEDAREAVRRCVLDEGRFVRMTLKLAPRPDPTALRRVVVRPVRIKGGRHLQFSQFDARRDITKNYRGAEAAARLDEVLALPFRSITVQATDGDLTVERTAGGGVRLRRHAAPEERVPDLTHDTRKALPLPVGSPDALLQRLGIMDERGNIRPGKHDKFAQISEFLKLLEQSGVVEPVEGRPLSVVDCGCGNAYLTFAVLHYLQAVRGIPGRMVGIDADAEVLEKNAELGEELGVGECRLVAGRIADFRPEGPVDIVLALHACDTATDEALAQGVRWEAPLIMAAPCCHHHLQAQLQPPPAYRPLARHGILKERLGDLLTDAFRAHLLRLCGYATDVVQFVSGEHTDRNVLIRAVRRNLPPDPALVEEYVALKQQWGVTPYLETLLAERLAPLLAGRAREAS